MKLSIIILNYLTFEKTNSCIERLQSNGSDIDRVIIIDNASGNNSLEEIEDFLKVNELKHERLAKLKPKSESKYLLFQNDENSGYAKGNNIGIEIAKNCDSEYILILNNDVLVNSGAIEEMYQFLKDNKELGCVGPIVKEAESYDFNFARKRLRWYDHFLLSGISKKLFPWKSLRKHHFFAYSPLPKNPFLVDIISGSCMLFPTSVLNEIEGFDKNTFLYYEEAIICEKLIKKGFKTVVLPQASVVHEHAGSISKVRPTKILKHSLHSQFYYLNKIRKYNGAIAHTLMIGQYLTYFAIALISRLKHEDRN